MGKKIRQKFPSERFDNVVVVFQGIAQLPQLSRGVSVAADQGPYSTPHPEHSSQGKRE
jgi:hypothetical protein